MKLTWLTDIHLNFLSKEERYKFYMSLKKEDNTILITGDIGESSDVLIFLEEMADYVKLPILFLLGNHDYYGTRVTNMKHELLELQSKFLYYIPYLNCPYKLNDDTALMGVDGWADGRAGDFKGSRIVMNDHLLIKDFDQFPYNIDRKEILKVMKELSRTDEELLQIKLKGLSKHVKNIIIATHVPPFEKMCLYDGKKSHEHYIPFYCSKNLGKVIKTYAKNNLDKNITVLSGHTHSRFRGNITKNIYGKVGDAQYYYPKIEEILEF